MVAVVVKVNGWMTVLELVRRCHGVMVCVVVAVSWGCSRVHLVRVRTTVHGCMCARKRCAVVRRGHTTDTKHTHLNIYRYQYRYTNYTHLCIIHLRKPQHWHRFTANPRTRPPPTPS